MVCFWPEMFGVYLTFRELVLHQSRLMGRLIRFRGKEKEQAERGEWKSMDFKNCWSQKEKRKYILDTKSKGIRPRRPRDGTSSESPSLYFRMLTFVSVNLTFFSQSQSEITCSLASSTATKCFPPS